MDDDDDSSALDFTDSLDDVDDMLQEALEAIDIDSVLVAILKVVAPQLGSTFSFFNGFVAFSFTCCCELS